LGEFIQQQLMAQVPAFVFKKKKQKSVWVIEKALLARSVPPLL